MTNIREIAVKKDDDGQRLDRWIKKYAPDIPYVLVQKLLRKGQIRVDGGRSKTDTRLSVGQVVRLPPFISNPYEDAQGEKKYTPDRPSERDIEAVRQMVLYDDGDVIALNKPPGLAVQGGTNTKRHLDGMLDALTGKDGVRPRLVHRLDKDTSGILLLARSAKVAKSLGDMFKRHDIRKIYWAITAGVPNPMEGKIKAKIAKGGGIGKEKMFVNDEEGKYAETEYVTLEWAAQRAAFVAFWPRTGRTHQIRVHAATVLNCPVLGDGKYGGEEAQIEGIADCRYMHLHARRVILPHPTHKGKILDITAELPDGMLQTWRNLGFNPKDKNDPFRSTE